MRPLKILRHAAGSLIAFLKMPVVFRMDHPVVRKRRALCKACPKVDTVFHHPICSICSCSIAGKTRLASERCPDKRW